MKTTQKGFIIPLLLIIVAILLAGGGAYIYTNSEFTLEEKGTPDSANKDVALPQATTTAQTSNTQTKVVSQLVLDLANVKPQFIDENGYGELKDGTPLPNFALQIKKDIATIFTPTSNEGYHLYSKAENIYLIAIGKRYVIFGDKNAKEGYYGELFDSVTNTSLPMGSWAPQIFHTDKFAVHVSPSDICTYTLDQPLCVTLPGSKLNSSEGYWDTMGGSFGITETHTNTSLTISVFDYATSKKLRDVTFALPALGQILNSGPTGISFPVTCKIAGSAGSVDPSNGIALGENEWLINCGSANNGNARATMEPVLKQQGWAFCDSGLATASWWKAGTLTSINEGSADRAGVSYPFSISQSQSASVCIASTVTAPTITSAVYGQGPGQIILVGTGFLNASTIALSGSKYATTILHLYPSNVHSSTGISFSLPANACDPADNNLCQETYSVQVINSGSVSNKILVTSTAGG